MTLPEITAKVIGTYSKSPNWIVLTILIILAIIGIVLFFKKYSPKLITEIEVPQVIRKITKIK